MTLRDKIDTTMTLMLALLEMEEPKRIAVAWTAGKDSTVALHLWQKLLMLKGLAPVRAISIDTGCKFPEVVALRDQVAEDWDIELTIARPEVDLASYPVARDKLSCCRDLKIAPLNKAIADTGTRILITGLRADEHASRSDRLPLESRSGHIQSNPLLYWTEMDVWAAIHEYNLPHCSLYDQGYRSLGCRPCTDLPQGAGERSGRDQAKEAQLGVLHSLGYF